MARFILLVLVGFFTLVTLLYLALLGFNDAGFILALVIGSAGSALALRMSPIRVRNSEAIGAGLIGLALFFMIANLFQVPLV